MSRAFGILRVFVRSLYPSHLFVPLAVCLSGMLLSSREKNISIYNYTLPPHLSSAVHIMFSSTSSATPPSRSIKNLNERKWNAPNLSSLLISHMWSRTNKSRVRVCVCGGEPGGICTRCLCSCWISLMKLFVFMTSCHAAASASIGFARLASGRLIAFHVLLTSSGVWIWIIGLSMAARPAFVDRLCVILLHSYLTLGLPVQRARS